MTFFENKTPSEVLFAKSDKPVATLRRFHMIHKKQLFAYVLLWVAMAVLLVSGMENVNSLREYPSVSLRYDKPISGKVAYSARQYSIEHDGENTFWLTFWHETKAEYEADHNSTAAACILFSGDAAVVWPARYLAGVAPSVIDGVGCMVSSALAGELWGGYDIVGKSVEVDNEPRVVRGVFESTELLALVAVKDEDTSQSFSAVELTGGPANATRSDAEGFAIAAGLGQPGSVLMGTPVSFSAILAILPLLILIIYSLALCYSKFKFHRTVLRIVLLLSFFGFALLLPVLLDMLPDWVIPTRWSDFSFWGELANRLGDNLREYLVLSPLLRDVEYKILLYKQIGIAFLSVSCSLFICFSVARMNNKITR